MKQLWEEVVGQRFDDIDKVAYHVLQMIENWKLSSK